MRCRFCRWAPRIALALTGAAAVVLALGAFQLGFDNNPAIGPRRILLLAAGLSLIVLAVRYRPPASSPTDESATEGAPASPRFPLAPALAVAFATLAFFTWQTFAGNPLDPPTTTYYYDMQAEAFVSGQTALKVVPDPRLAEIRDPYDPAQRRGMPRCRLGQTTNCFLNDASYYEGKYYLNWGPAPAVILAGIKLLGVGAISDGLMALIGASALFLVLASIATALFRQFYARLPSWLLIASLALCGLAYPLSWILDAPFIYEAAVVLGALFFATGLALAIPVLTDRNRNLWRLAGTGVCWGLAAATRVPLALSVTVLTAIIMLHLARHGTPGTATARRWLEPAAIGVPVLAVGILLGAYNFARFSDPLEFGFRYALVSRARPLQADGYTGAFRLAHLPATTAAYLATPFLVEREFPFFSPKSPTRTVSFGTVGPITIAPDDMIFQYPMVGLPIAAPFFILATYAGWWWLCGSECRSQDGLRADRRGLRNVIGVLLAASLFGLLPILADYVVTPRYLMDGFPSLVLLASLGAWELYRAHEPGRVARQVVSGLILLAALVSVVMSSLLALNNWTL